LKREIESQLKRTLVTSHHFTRSIEVTLKFKALRASTPMVFKNQLLYTVVSIFSFFFSFLFFFFSLLFFKLFFSISISIPMSFSIFYFLCFMF
jgi:hypothetical protein